MAPYFRFLFTALDSEDRERLLHVSVFLPTGTIWVHLPEATPAGIAERWPADPEIPLGFYRHFKGGRYRALVLGHSVEAAEQAIVVYLSLDHGTVWARPATMWAEETDRWPDGKTRPRFVQEAAEVAALFSR